jgi:hypothetical protein
MSKTIEAIAQVLADLNELDAPEDWCTDAQRILLAMREGEALEEMVERAEVAMKSIDDGKQTYGSLSAAAIRAALMVEP